jgi:hypothetical protein
MRKLVLVGIALLMAVSCGPIMHSSYNSDPDADFSQYSTFAWDEPLNKAANESYNPLVNNTLVEKQLKSAIESEMTSRGYKLVESNPDLFVNFHTMVESKSEVSSYPNNYYFWWRNDVRTINYEEGTLIVDVIDAKKDQLVWQGFTSNELRTQKLAESLKSAVQKVFSKYPYRAGMGEVISKKD